MKLSERVLTLPLCCFLLRFAAQAKSSASSGQADGQMPAPRVRLSSQVQQQLATPILAPHPAITKPTE